MSEVTESKLPSDYNVAASFRGYFTAACIGLSGSLIRLIPARNTLPEPFDVIDHIGNINCSTTVGYVAAVCVGATVAEHDGATKLGVRRAMLFSGTLAGVALNTICETRLGMNLTGIGNTADPIDFAYGVCAAAATASLVPIRPSSQEQ